MKSIQSSHGMKKGFKQAGNIFQTWNNISFHLGLSRRGRNYTGKEL